MGRRNLTHSCGLKPAPGQKGRRIADGDAIGLTEVGEWVPCMGGSQMEELLDAEGWRGSGRNAATMIEMQILI